MAADVALETDVVRLFEAVDRELGRVTALVNNAGILEKQTRLDGIDAARLHRIFATNVTGTFICSREAVRRMSTRRGGAGGGIVNVSSRASQIGSPGEYIDYAASKGAVDSLTIGLAKEVAEEGIRVNAVRPGFIYTDMHASGGEPNRVDRVKDIRAHEARRQGGRGCQRHSLAAFRGGVLYYGCLYRRIRRAIKPRNKGAKRAQIVQRKAIIGFVGGRQSIFNYF